MLLVSIQYKVRDKDLLLFTDKFSQTFDLYTRFPPYWAPMSRSEVDRLKEGAQRLTCSGQWSIELPPYQLAFWPFEKPKTQEVVKKPAARLPIHPIQTV